MKERPVRASVAAAVSARRERRERLDAAARAKWQFWRWRPKVSLCTFQILALFIGAIVLVSLRSTPWRARYTLNCGAYPVTSIAFSGDSLTLLTSANDGYVRMWDADSGQQLSSLEKKQRVLSADFSPDGSRAVLLCEDGAVQLWNGQTDAKPIELFNNPRLGSVHFSPDGQKICMVNAESARMYSAVSIFNLNNNSIESVFVPTDCLSSVQFTKDGSRLICSTSDGLVQVWGLTKTYEVVAALRGDMNFFRSAVFSPDGQHIATAGNDCTVRLWTASSGENAHSIVDVDKDKEPPDANGGHTWFAKPLRILRGHNRYVVSAKFSPEGDRLATVSLDGCVRIWGGRDGAELFTLTRSGPWRSAVFAPDGKSLALAGNDGTVQLWNLRCSERWYGKLMLPEFWLMILLIPAVVWSLRRDQRSLLGGSPGGAGVSARTISHPNEELPGTEARSTKEKPPEDQGGSTADSKSN